MPNPTQPVSPNLTLTHALPRPNQPGPRDPIAASEIKLRKAASEFESIFLSHLIKTMQSTVHKTKTGESLGGEVMLDLASEKLGENLAKKGGVGLGDMIYNLLSRHLPRNPDDTKPADQPVKRQTDLQFYPLGSTPSDVDSH